MKSDSVSYLVNLKVEHLTTSHLKISCFGVFAVLLVGGGGGGKTCSCSFSGLWELITHFCNTNASLPNDPLERGGFLVSQKWETNKKTFFPQPCSFRFVCLLFFFFFFGGGRGERDLSSGPHSTRKVRRGAGWDLSQTCQNHFLTSRGRKFVPWGTYLPINSGLAAAPEPFWVATSDLRVEFEGLLPA